MVIVGIVAGGKGERMGGELPKQFLELDGKPIAVYTAERFLSSGLTDALIIGVNPLWRDYMDGLAEKYFKGMDNVTVVNGGADRNGTIMNIIAEAEKKFGLSERDTVITHDAVRPFVSERIISDSIKAMEFCDICTAAVPVTDTVVVSENGACADAFPDRSKLRLVQTPQTFKADTFKSVYNSVCEEERSMMTDVCGMYRLCGYDERLINGDVSNIKITYPEDYERAKLYAEKIPDCFSEQ